jgi:hypothetical protein
LQDCPPDHGVHLPGDDREPYVEEMSCDDVCGVCDVDVRAEFISSVECAFTDGEKGIRMQEEAGVEK